MLHRVDPAHHMASRRLDRRGDLVRHLHPDRGGLEGGGRQIQHLRGEQVLSAHPAPLVAGDARRHLHPALDEAEVSAGTGALAGEDLGLLLLLRPGVVGGLHRLDGDDPLVPVELRHQILTAVVQVDGALVALLENVRGADRADDPGLRAPGSAGFDGVARTGGAQVHLAVGVAPGGEPFAARFAAQELPLQLQALEAGPLRVAGEPGLLLAQRELGGGAGKVGAGYLGVVRVEYGVLEALVEEHPGMVDQVLIQGVGLRDHGDQRFPAAPDASRALPGGDLAARVSHQQTYVQPPDIDSHLQGRGGDHSEEISLEEPALDLPALLGKKAGPIGADGRGDGRIGLDDPGVHQLGDAPGLGEGDGAQSIPHRHPEQARCGRVG